MPLCLLLLTRIVEALGVCLTEWADYAIPCSRLGYQRCCSICPPGWTVDYHHRLLNYPTTRQRCNYSSASTNYAAVCQFQCGFPRIVSFLSYQCFEILALLSLSQKCRRLLLPSLSSNRPLKSGDHDEWRSPQLDNNVRVFLKSVYFSPFFQFTPFIISPLTFRMIILFRWTYGQS